MVNLKKQSKFPPLSTDAVSMSPLQSGKCLMLLSSQWLINHMWPTQTHTKVISVSVFDKILHFQYPIFRDSVSGPSLGSYSFKQGRCFERQHWQSYTADAEADISDMLSLSDVQGTPLASSSIRESNEGFREAAVTIAPPPYVALSSHFEEVNLMSSGE